MDHLNAFIRVKMSKTVTLTKIYAVYIRRKPKKINVKVLNKVFTFLYYHIIKFNIIIIIAH